MPFHELYIRGNKPDLDRFVQTLPQFANNGWVYRNEVLNDWLYHFYRNEGYDIEISLLYKDDKQCYYVPNIVPLQRQQITTDEYNNYLDCFFNEVVAPCANQPTFQNIVNPVIENG